MVTNSLYKSYSTQIAKLFCSESTNKSLCEASIKQRLDTFLDDYTYPVFLSKINQGRQYITNLEAFQNKGFRIVLTDLISGERVTAWWNVPYNMPYYSVLPNKLLSHQYNIISANKTFNAENRSDNRITWNPIKPTYGITFVPSQPPGYVPPGGGGYVPPGGGGYVPPGGGGNIIPTPTPAQSPNVPASSFDIKSLLDNPILLIGAGLVAVYFLMKK